MWNYFKPFNYVLRKIKITFTEPSFQILSFPNSPCISPVKCFRVLTWKSRSVLLLLLSKFPAVKRLSLTKRHEAPKGTSGVSVNAESHKNSLLPKVIINYVLSRFYGFFPLWQVRQARKAKSLLSFYYFQIFSSSLLNDWKSKPVPFNWLTQKYFKIMSSKIWVLTVGQTTCTFNFHESVILAFFDPKFPMELFS